MIRLPVRCNQLRCLLINFSRLSPSTSGCRFLRKPSVATSQCCIAWSVNVEFCSWKSAFVSAIMFSMGSLCSKRISDKIIPPSVRGQLPKKYLLTEVMESGIFVGQVMIWLALAVCLPSLPDSGSVL